MLTDKEYHTLIHDLANAGLKVRKLKNDIKDLMKELEHLAKDFEEIKEKIT